MTTFLLVAIAFVFWGILWFALGVYLSRPYREPKSMLDAPRSKGDSGQ